MLVLKIIFIAAIYIAIGGLLCGIVDAEDDIGMFVAAWPLFVVIAIVIAIAEFPRQFGKAFHDRWWGDD